MAVGDFPAGSWIEISEGYLRHLTDGLANVADVEYAVVLPSGGRVPDAGEGQPFHYTAVGSVPPGMNALAEVINYGGLVLLGALAKRHGLPVHVTNGVVNADGSFTPKAP